MKKTIVLALALVLAMNLAVPVAAVSSPVAPATSETTTAPLPEVIVEEVKTENGATIVIEPVAADKVEEMPKEDQKTFLAAQEKLAEAKPADMKTQYFFYVTIVKTDEERSFREGYDGAVNMTVKIANVKNVVVKQFVDGKWVELEAIINADGTVTIQGVVEGPIAIFTK